MPQAAVLLDIAERGKAGLARTMRGQHRQTQRHQRANLVGGDIVEQRALGGIMPIECGIAHPGMICDFANRDRLERAVFDQIQQGGPQRFA